MWFYGLIQPENILRQVVVGLFFVLLADEATHHVFQTDAHAVFKVGLELGHIDKQIRFKALLSYLGYDTILKVNISGFCIIQIDDRNTLPGGQFPVER